MAVPGPDHVYWQHMHIALSHWTINIVHQCICITQYYVAYLAYSVHVMQNCSI